MEIYLPDEMYSAISNDLLETFIEQTKTDSENLKKGILSLSEGKKISEELVNFISVSCAMTYYATLKSTQEIMKKVLCAVLAAGFNAASEAAKESSDSPESGNT